ncbi:clavaminate synthase family protein [Kineosporia mesophila]|uniref:Clavaminate synthase family protein n=1 Tax=Kineosporia mesophila TaxID=566012 RepID=A0ABP6Z9X6_9ACTN|nr:guanitoxin biosynthesis L-enduracididine beta-hydroxylase GntD [Kineosporia mesophila]MCD5354917.1 TauD/TfdA family dioxygenase [Kineosporia mesophila]
MDPKLNEYTLSGPEADGIRAGIESLARSGAAPKDPEFYEENWQADTLLPSGVHEFLRRFRRSESGPVCVIHGFPVDDAQVGATPGHWREALGVTSTRAHETYMAMCAMALGDPFTWSTLQTGAMVQNLLPVRGDELLQNGYSSDAMLEFHTEDGFHPARCDYLILFGIRNPDAVPTFVASVRDVKLEPMDRQMLSQPRFLIRPDDEHIRQLRLIDPDHPSLAQAIAMKENPRPVPVLFGDRMNPYLRVDRPFMQCVDQDRNAGRALDALMDELERVRESVTVGQGDLVIVDNYLAVHGRQAFHSRYDGTDRWLKRMIVSRDLRRSAAYRDVNSSRVLF